MLGHGTLVFILRTHRSVAMSVRCRFLMFSTSKAQCLQSWLLRAPEGINTCCQATRAYLPLLLGLTVSGSLSLGKLDEPGTFWAEDSGQGFGTELPKKVPAIWQGTPLTMVSSPSPVSSRPSYMFRCLILLPFRSPDLSESLYSKDRFWS